LKKRKDEEEKRSEKVGRHSGSKITAPVFGWVEDWVVRSDNRGLRVVEQPSPLSISSDSVPKVQAAYSGGTDQTNDSPLQSDAPPNTSRNSEESTKSTRRPPQRKISGTEWIRSETLKLSVVSEC